MAPEPELTTAQNGSEQPVASLDAITALIHSFGSMMASMEGRITKRIDENAAVSKERWTRWEAEFKEYRAANDRRIAALENRVEKIEDEDHDERLVWDARLGPVKRVTYFVSHNWRSILIIIFAILGALGLATNVLENGLHGLGLP